MIYYVSKEPVNRFDVVPITYHMLTDAKTHCKLIGCLDSVVVEVTEDAPTDYLPKSNKIPKLMIKLSDDTPITQDIITKLIAMFPQFSGPLTRAFLSDTEEGLRTTIKATFASSYEFIKEVGL